MAPFGICLFPVAISELGAVRVALTTFYVIEIIDYS